MSGTAKESPPPADPGEPQSPQQNSSQQSAEEKPPPESQGFAAGFAAAEREYAAHVRGRVTWAPTTLRGALAIAGAVFLVFPKTTAAIALLAIAFVGGLFASAQTTGTTTEELAAALLARLAPPSDENIGDESDGPRRLAQCFGRSREYPVVFRAGIADNVDCALNAFLDYLMRDVVNNWYRNLNHSGSPQFTEQVRTSLNIVFHRLLVSARRTSPVSVALLASQAAILHLREYRRFERAGKPFAAFVAGADAGSPLALVHTQALLLRQLRATAQHVVAHLVPAEDGGSPLVHALLVELTASLVLEPIVELLADPDWINQQIIRRLGAATPAPGAGQVVQDRSRGRARRADASDRLLYVKIVEGRHFPVAAAGATSFYCSLMCGHERARSRKLRCEASPIWLQEYKFGLDRQPELSRSRSRAYVDGLVVDVYRSGTMWQSGQLLGSVYVPLANVRSNEFARAWHIVDDDGKGRDTARNDSAGGRPEILLEVMLIESSAGSEATGPPVETVAVGDADAEGDGEALRERKLVDALELERVHEDGELVVQFMQYMAEKRAENLVRFYLSLETFQMYAVDPLATPEALRQDAQAYYEMFFTPRSRSNVLALFPVGEDGSPHPLVAALHDEVTGKVSPQVFDRVAAVIVGAIRRDHWIPFKQSAQFREWWREYRLRELPVAVAKDVVDAPAESESARPPALYRVEASTDSLATVARAPSIILEELPPRVFAVDDAWGLWVQQQREKLLATRLGHCSVLSELQRRRCASDSATHMVIESRSGLVDALNLERLDFAALAESARKKHQERQYRARVEAAQNERDGTHFLSSQLTTLREQIAILDEALERRHRAQEHAATGPDLVYLTGHHAGLGTASGGGASADGGEHGGTRLSGSQMRRMRAELVVQVRHIEQMLREMASEQDVPAAAAQPAVNLHDVQVEIIETGIAQAPVAPVAAAEAAGASPARSSLDLFALEPTVIGTLSAGATDAAGVRLEALYTVQVMSTRSGKGWIKQKSYGQFVALHDALRRQFPKVAKMPFPSDAAYKAVAAGPVSTAVSTAGASTASLESTLSAGASAVAAAAAAPPLALFQFTERAVKGLGKMVDTLVSMDAVPTAGGDDTAAGRERRPVVGCGHARALQSYLAIVCMDMVLAESRDLKQFFRPEAAPVVSSPASTLDRATEDSKSFSAERLPETLRLEAGPVPPVRTASIAAAATPDDAARRQSRESSVLSTGHPPGPMSPASPASLVWPTSPTSPASNASATRGPHGGLPPPTPLRADIDASPPRTPAQTDAPAPAELALEAADIDILLECAFSLVDEVFALTGDAVDGAAPSSGSSGASAASAAPQDDNVLALPLFWAAGGNNWLRLKGLTVVKQLVRRTQGRAIHSVVRDWLETHSSDESLTRVVDWLTGTLWPGDRSALIKRAPPRPQEVQDDARALAKHVWLQSAQQGRFGGDLAVKLIGRYNSMAGMTRLFNMLQTREINRHLIVVILDRVLRSMLSQGP